eukprot:scaffold4015_cov200-Skeletonema_marinoi.AAC.15
MRSHIALLILPIICLVPEPVLGRLVPIYIYRPPPTSSPTSTPSISYQPSSRPSSHPSHHPSPVPSMHPSHHPTSSPSVSLPPSSEPTSQPTLRPSSRPSSQPSISPTRSPSSTYRVSRNFLKSQAISTSSASESDVISVMRSFFPFPWRRRCINITYREHLQRAMTKD